MFAKIAVKVGKTSDPTGNRTPVSGVRGQKLLTIISLVESRVFH